MKILRKIILLLAVLVVPFKFVDAQVSVIESTMAFAVYDWSDALYPSAPWEKCFPYKRIDFDKTEGLKINEKIIKTVILENEYLKVTVLPDVGGRIFSAIFKPTGKDMFFTNPRLKPCDLYGIGTSWTCMVGGLKYSFPSDGHSPSDIIPWDYKAGNNSVTVYHTDLETNMKISVTVTLKEGCADFELFTRLENPNSFKQRYCYWNCAQIEHRSNIKFIFPTDKMILHEGNWGYPVHTMISWPVYKGKDLSLFRNWTEGEQGLFPYRNDKDFVGTYDFDAKQGVVRIFPVEKVKGTKVWCFDRLDPPYDDYFDSKIMYYEMFGGITETQEDFTCMGPKSEVTWTEYWYPIKETSGFVYATKDIALNLSKTSSPEGGIQLSLAASANLEGLTIRVQVNDKLLDLEDISLNPSLPWGKKIIPEGYQLNPQDKIIINCINKNKTEILKYEAIYEKI